MKVHPQICLIMYTAEYNQRSCTGGFDQELLKQHTAYCSPKSECAVCVKATCNLRFGCV